jgi:pimeloyl-ACP methyl ester carboxylesterase
MTSRAQVRSHSASGTVVAVRAREPDRCGYAVRSGVRLYYEVFGSGPTTVLFLPPWAIVHSRTWKMQVPYLARHFRVVTYDARGNGHSDRPLSSDDYADTELVADAVAVLDATGTDAAVCVGPSSGAGLLLRLAAEHPNRVLGAVFVAPTMRLAEVVTDRSLSAFEDELGTDEGWAKFNSHYWRRDYAGFAEFFFAQAFVEPRSTKHIEDGVGWALQTDPETLIETARAPYLGGDLATAKTPAARHFSAQVRCPSLVIHGDQDRIAGGDSGPALAAALGCGLERFEGAGHCLHARHPVRFNGVLRSFVQSIAREG